MNWNIFWQIIILLGIIFVLGYLILRYLNGNYTFKDEIIQEDKYLQGTRDRTTGETKTEQIVRRIIIKRTYESGKIKFITKEV